ncbi:MAG: hypothetical protein IPK88_07750 [Saprospiraceae bacterium]|nr:hypothetical protein [Candidatus Defluviibacterium haderslevense]
MTQSAQRKNIVYALYPNANGFGFVYLENPRKLLDYGAVRINPISNRKVLERIKRSFDYLRPSIVIIQDPNGIASRSGRRVHRLMDKIIAMANEEKLKVVMYSRDQIREVFEQFGAVTKYEIAKVLLTEFKELGLREPKKRKTWESESHNMPIFDALSLALTWFWLNEY